MYVKILFTIQWFYGFMRKLLKTVGLLTDYQYEIVNGLISPIFILNPRRKGTDFNSVPEFP